MSKVAKEIYDPVSDNMINIREAIILRGFDQRVKEYVVNRVRNKILLLELMRMAERQGLTKGKNRQRVRQIIHRHCPIRGENRKFHLRFGILQARLGRR